jgi:putative colanic acid biosynthesis acetyltransferase WcaF
MQKTSLDIAANREAFKYPGKIQIKRLLWGLINPLFRYSPRTFFGFRNFLLKIFGAKTGSNVHIYNSAIIYMPWNLEISDWSSIGEYAFIYNLGCISIGSQVTISYRAHLCAGTHDYTDPALPLLKLPIRINDQAWICADAFVGPGVTIGEGAVVGARAVAVKDIEPWAVVGGNPARTIGQRTLRSTGLSSASNTAAKDTF